MRAWSAATAWSCFIKIARDETERRAVDAALRGSEAWLRAVIDAAPVGLMFADGRRVGGHEHPLARVACGEVERAEIEAHVQLPDGSLRWVR